MFDKDKIDSFFNQTTSIKRNKKSVSEKLRLVLPMIAVLLLGMLVLFPSIEEETRSFAFEITKPLDGELEKLMVENLNLFITDENNLVHNFVATHIEEIDVEKKITKLDNLDSIYNSDEKVWLGVKTSEGYFYQNENILKMPNKVDVFYSDGVEVVGVDVVSDFNESVMYSKSPVLGKGFLGNIDADGFEFDMKTNVLTFVGNVKIIKSEEE